MKRGLLRGWGPRLALREGTLWDSEAIREAIPEENRPGAAPLRDLDAVPTAISRVPRCHR